jgi:hypothetical protein
MKENGAFVFGVCNVVGSSVSKKLMLEPIHMQVQKLDSFYKKRLQRKLRY